MILDCLVFLMEYFIIFIKHWFKFGHSKSLALQVANVKTICWGRWGSYTCPLQACSCSPPSGQWSCCGSTCRACLSSRCLECVCCPSINTCQHDSQANQHLATLPCHSDSLLLGIFIRPAAPLTFGDSESLRLVHIQLENSYATISLLNHTKTSAYIYILPSTVPGDLCGVLLL